MKRRPFGLAIIALILCGAAAGGQEPFPDLWRWAQFTTGDGLPSNFVSSVIEVPGDGMWAATRAGLARFDGYRWQPVPLPPGHRADNAKVVPLGGGQVIVISGARVFSGRAGDLQEVTERLPAPMGAGAAGTGGKAFLLSKEGVLCEWSGRACEPRDPGGNGRVYSLLPAGSGRAWVSTDRGVFSWNGTAWQQRLEAKDSPCLLQAVLESGDGSAWAYVERPPEQQGLWHWPAGYAGPRRAATPSPISALALGSGRSLVAVHSTGDLAVQRAQRWGAIATGSLVLDVRSVATLASGDTALATDQGVFLYRASARRWSMSTLPPPDAANSVNELARAADGTVWLGTAGGVCRLGADGRLERAAGTDQAPGGSITGLAFDRRGRLWASSGDAWRGVRVREGGQWRRPRLDPLLDGTYVHRIATDREGGVWFLGLSETLDRGTPLPMTGPGAFRLGADGRITRWGEAQGLLSGRVYAFGEGPDGAFWFGTVLGLSRYRNGEWRHWTTAEGLRTSRVFTLAIDAEGTVWFGHQALGLGTLRDDRVSYVPPQEGLVGEAVWNVCADSRGRLWVASEGGVSLLETGRWTAFRARSGLPKTRVWGLLPDGDRLFIGTHGGGVARLTLSEAAPGPVVKVERVLLEADSALVSWTPSAWWAEMPSDVVPTRIQLDDGPWSEWTTKREHRYLGLGAGTHHVRVQAKGLLGTLGRASEPIALNIEPPPLLRPVVLVPLAALTLLATALLGLLAWRGRQHHLALHDSEERFRAVFRSSPLPAVITRLEDGSCTDANAALERLIGLPRAELVGRTRADESFVVGEFDRERVVRALEKDGSAFGVPFQVRRASSNEILDVLAYFRLFELGGRRLVLSQIIDVTAQRRLELQLRQAQKIESVGRLAGGIAHDFNNLLTVILGNASLVAGALPEGDPRREEVEQVRLAAERAERLTRQLLAFARKQVVEPRPVDVNDTVARIERLLRRLIGEDIDLITMPGEVDAVLIDPGQLEQVLVNMVVNARDAMPAGGRLTITTSNVTIGNPEPAGDPETLPGPYVRLSIADTGVGMDAATAARAFDPFFTTKEAGKGTGLGLAVCYGIVKQAGGQLLVESRPGRGTTFHVDLPRAMARQSDPEPVGGASDVPAGKGTVLLVEDEAQVRRLAAEVLRKRGYEVLEAASGSEAIALAERHAARIDVLLTDVVMPQMRGTEVARALRASRPGLKVVYMSGYTDDEEFRKDAGPGAFAFLAKPFTPGALGRCVRDVLDAAVG